MEKCLIILIIIIILYYIQKYCIQLEVDKILITKNIIEKFTDNISSTLSGVLNNLSQTNHLDISASLIINNRHKLTSDGNYLKITDISDQNFLNMSVKNLDVSNQLLVRQNSTFIRGPHSFNFLNIDTSGNNAGIKSLQGPLNIDASVNKIIFSGNTDISGNLTINNLKPILIKTFTTNSSNIDTGISHSRYPGIGFAGYDQSSNTTFEFNTYKQNENWFISFTPKRNSNTLLPIKIRLIFFNAFFHIDLPNITLTNTLTRPSIPSIIESVINDRSVTLTWEAPPNIPNYAVSISIIPPSSSIIVTYNDTTATISGLNYNTFYTFNIIATNEGLNSEPLIMSFSTSGPTPEPTLSSSLVSTGWYGKIRVNNTKFNSYSPGTTITYRLFRVNATDGTLPPLLTGPHKILSGAFHEFDLPITDRLQYQQSQLNIVASWDQNANVLGPSNPDQPWRTDGFTITGASPVSLYYNISNFNIIPNNNNGLITINYVVN